MRTYDGYQTGIRRIWANVLSFAVLALAVEDMKALERVMTSARPCAFLPQSVNATDIIERDGRTWYCGTARRASKEPLPGHADLVHGHRPAAS